MHIYLENTATLLRQSAQFTYPVHVVWESSTAKRRVSLTDHACTLLTFLPVLILELAVVAEP